MGILYVIIGILAFSLLIIIHELGHFAVARLMGVRVEEFSIGIFGPTLYERQGKNVKFIIKAGLFGGYVKLFGEEDEEESKEPYSFASKSPFQKILVFIAGPFMNIVLGILLFAIFTNNIGYGTNEIDKVSDNSPAMISGLKQGDKILKLNNSKISTWDDFSIKMAQTDHKDNVLLQVERNKELMEFNVKPTLQDNRYVIGILFKTIDPNFSQCIKSGVDESISITKQTFAFFGNIFKGKVKKDDVGGPITMVRVAAKSASLGINNLLFFLALVSMQLAIFNLLPFPALDGGWIFIMLFQIITGKKVKEETIGTINYIGMMILMAFMLIVLLKDIISPIKF
ncbi:regulator of sigma E protease [Hathewaya proteolytica DSM 3090]|uniref:Zinc metalloprotease n=1 Tax=Hathewaya proteolytica DSM 3090 TaxID=1121331 RepID=A0A1M6J6E3_9CLOT|nr:RIP metalloprotease RseP [Hathewaya proteolytica]SHJ42215.1 regulator of sigma E protease [Hathewaya proteolytica DSM 3090]